MVEGSFFDNAQVHLLPVVAVLILTFLVITVTRGRVFGMVFLAMLPVLRSLHLIRRAPGIRRTQPSLKKARLAAARLQQFIGPGDEVGTSGVAPVRRLFRTRTETERALNLVDVRHVAVEQAVKDLTDSYSVTGDSDEDFDDALDILPEKIVHYWSIEEARILSGMRKRFFEQEKRQIGKWLAQRTRHLLEDKNVLLEAAEEGHDPKEFVEQQAQLADRYENGDFTFEEVDFGIIETEYPLDDLYRVEWEDTLHKSAFKREEANLEKSGFLFQEFSALPTYLASQRPVDEFQSHANYLVANFFFNYDVATESDPDDLYEDINDASIVHMTGHKDRLAFFYLTQWRKIVNSNVFRLATAVGLFLSLYVIANFTFSYYSAGNIWFSKLVDIVNQTVLDRGMAVQEAQVRDIINRSTFAIVSYFVCTGIVGFIFRFPYSHFQRQNKTQLTNFIKGYTSNLIRDYSRAESNAKGAFSGDRMRKSSKEVAKIWFINLQWVALRVLFLDMFIRSVLYQVRRNSGYYILGMPIVFIAPIIFTLWYVYPILVPSAVDRPYDIVQGILANIVFLVLFIRMAYFVFWRKFLRNCVKGLIDISDAEWQNFHEFKMQSASAGLIRHYVGEIYNERVRVRGGGGS